MIWESELFQLANILNLNHVPEQFVEDYLGGKATTLFLGAAAGSEKFYVNVDKISPGSKSAKYHAHSKQEEFFLILSGNGTLRMNGQEYPVKKGDFVAKPAGRDIAHPFINTGTEVLEILDVGTKEDGDIAYYPDEEVILLRDQRKAFKLADAMPDWDSEPNKEDSR
ncbi:cupin domain-containing protein [Brevibacillus sp. H7]|uniref:cupin domain-containing protein n=1 Tax=Brevibacillus sp. H7 TaxID=3349138 RepID=UPI00380B6F0F